VWALVGRGSGKTQLFCGDLPFRRQADLLRLKARRADPRTLQLYAGGAIYTTARRAFRLRNRHRYEMLKTPRGPLGFSGASPYQVWVLADIVRPRKRAALQLPTLPQYIDKSVRLTRFIDSIDLILWCIESS
jgi:hypothetical protein